MKALLTALAIFAALIPAPALAYSVASDFGDPCHERLAIDAYLNFAIDLPTNGVPLPDSEAWRKLSNELIRVNNVEDFVFDDPQRLIITSLIIGVRSPDTNGHGLFDFDSLRALHAAPDGQHIHALRAIDEDGPEGDLRAIEGIREEILLAVDQALQFAQRPPEEQIIEVNMYLDFYGLIKVDVWAVPFFLGKAMHTLQDSFSHTIRSDDLQRIRHVMNYVDAIGNSFEEGTDGMAHSDSMDKCVGETAPVYHAAREATVRLLVAIDEDAATNGHVALNAVLDKWITYEPGCTLDNNYCNSKWVPIARLKPTGPYVETILGCRVVTLARTPSKQGWIWILGLAFVASRAGRRS